MNEYYAQFEQVIRCFFFFNFKNNVRNSQF